MLLPLIFLLYWTVFAYSLDAISYLLSAAFNVTTLITPSTYFGKFLFAIFCLFIILLIVVL